MMDQGKATGNANQMKESMTSEVKDNYEFAQWIGRWTARIQQRKVPLERLPPGTTASGIEQTRPDPEGEGAKC